MADLVLGAALGTTFTVLYDAVREATVGKFKTIQPLLRAVESTLASIQPLVIKQIGDYNVKLELPNDEVEKLQKQMREGEELICRLSKLRWWNRIKSRYIVQLVELDASLKGLLTHIVMQQARDIKENLLVVKQTAKQFVQFQEFNERLLRERTLLQEDARGLQEKFVLQLQNNGEQLLQLQRVIVDMMMEQEVREVTDSETGDMVGVAALVTLFKVLFGNVQHLFKQNVTYKPVLRNIKSTLDSLGPVIEVIEETNRFLSYSEKRQIHCLAIEMRAGVELFRRCSKIGTWNIYKNLSYNSKLIQWDESLQREIDRLIANLDDQHYEKASSAPSCFGPKHYNDPSLITKLILRKNVE
uniref:uncharacterized protein LOC105351433 isoform X1 n=1 Tax=Fragaria vesca subsp. vesca TaxID=101020 RepID=UPI0005C932D0|nr:PREDICTED: uncharacterized protein LOC105351433 isoform X1 [Fragaria vesca subsp. vesca]